MSCNDRLLLLLSQRENRRILVERLSKSFESVLIEEKSPQSATVAVEDFDLIICDIVELGRWRDLIRHWRQAAEPLLLPVLVLLPKHAIGTLPADVRYQIDELITTPVDPDELAIRIAILLRSRRLSTELAQQNHKAQRIKRS